MKAIHLAIITTIGITTVTASGIFLINHASYQPMCVEGRLPNGTCAVPVAIDLGTSERLAKTGCDAPYQTILPQTLILPNGTAHTINKIPVFLMKPNSTGKICIENWSYDKGYTYSGKTMAGIGKNDSLASDVIINPSPSYISVDDTMNKTIVYTITTSKDANGFYRINPMFFNCGGLPLAVGYTSSYSFDNDFTWLWDTFPCPFGGIGVHITGLSGIDMAYITKVY